MRYFIDAEFHESGYGNPIELISLAVVCDDGREFYAVAADGWYPAMVSDWLKENVLPHLYVDTNVMNIPGGSYFPKCPRSEMAEMLTAFIKDEGANKPEIWGYYGDYDWVIFCQLFGRMIDLPKHFPRICLDIKQRCIDFGNPKLPKQKGQAHNALADARYNKTMFEFLEFRERFFSSKLVDAARASRSEGT